MVIDPDQYMPDVDRTNNTTKKGIKAHIIFDKPSYYDIDLNILPWPPTSNAYDGNSNGLYIRYGGGGGFGGKSVESWILYGDKTKSLNGILWFKKQIDNLWSLSTGRFESLIESRSGHDGISFSFIGNKNKRTRTNFEQTSIRLDAYYHNIKDIIAFNPDLYDIGEFGIGKIGISKFQNLENLIRNLLARAARKNFVKICWDLGSRLKQTSVILIRIVVAVVVGRRRRNSTTTTTLSG